MDHNAEQPYDPNGTDTVEVVGQDGTPLLINRSTYAGNPDNWTLYADRDRVPGTDQPPGGNSVEPPDGKPEYDVQKKGKRWHVVNKANGEIALRAEGYDSEVDAWSDLTNNPPA